MDYLPEWVVQLFLLLVVPAIVQVFKLWVNKFEPSELVKRIAIQSLSLILSGLAGAFYFAPEIPVWGGDIAKFIGDWIAIAGPFFVGVEVVYNFILKHLYEGLGWK